MVLQKAVDNLKEKPESDRKAVAGGLAIAVIAILFIGWTILFLKKIQRGGELESFGGAQQEFLGRAVRDAQQNILQDTSGFDELRTVRDRAIEQYQLPPTQESYRESDTNVFGQPRISD